MSSMITDNGHIKPSKKRKKKYASPFRIKIGCIVALRYRPRGNRISVMMPDVDPDVDADPSLSAGGGVEEESTNTYWEPVATARFSEVWTDPRRGRDDGLALIGSRIRCFFPKAILSEPYNAGSRLLEGTVVNVVRDSEDQVAQQQRESSGYSSLLVDLLVDNKNDKTLSVSLPFLKRIDDDGLSDTAGKNLKESEKRRRQYEERIKGGKHKAVVRVSLSDCGSSHSAGKTNNPLEAKWVIRKRVPTKIIRRDFPVPVLTETPTSTIDDEGGDREDSDTSRSRGNGGELCEDSDPKNESDSEKKAALSSPASPGLPESVKNKRRKTAIAANTTTTSFNKDFSLPRYLGDGNDSTAQQEGNWRWEAGRYHNPYHAALTDRPISKELLEKLSYNFVGEVVEIRPTKHPQQSTNASASIDTLAMVTIRLFVLPEHTHTGRLAHHGPFDLFEDGDLLEPNMLLLEGEQKFNNILQNSNVKPSEKQESQVKKNGKNNSGPVSPCLLQVPIEELVIVHRTTEEREMTIRHSYSFLSDTYNRSEEEKQRGAESLGDKVEEEKSEKHSCRRCQHLSSVSKRLAGVPHSMCESCFEFLKSSDAAKWGTYQNNKSKKYRCDCDFCVDRKNTDLLSNLASEVSESESKIGSTLQELEDYSAHRDSGLIATRFIMKGMNPVDFTISPSSLASFMHSASSKPITKIKARVSKGNKKSTPKKSARAGSNVDVVKRNGNMLPASQVKKRHFSVYKVLV